MKLFTSRSCINLSYFYDFQMNPKPTVFEILNFFEQNVARFLSTEEPKPMTTNDLNELGLWGEYGACSKYAYFPVKCDDRFW